MPTVTCPKCGTENAADATICRTCRINLKFALEHPEEIEPLKQREHREQRALTVLPPKFRWLAIAFSILLFAGSILLLRAAGIWIADSLSWNVADAFDVFEEAFADRPIGVSVLLIFLFLFLLYLLLILITWCLEGGIRLTEIIQRYVTRSK